MSVPSAAERRFVMRLHPAPAAGDWGFSLSELIGTESAKVAELPTHRARRRRAVIEAVTADGYPAAAVSPRQRGGPST